MLLEFAHFAPANGSTPVDALEVGELVTFDPDLQQLATSTSSAEAEMASETTEEQFIRATLRLPAEGDPSNAMAFGNMYAIEFVVQVKKRLSFYSARIL